MGLMPNVFLILDAAGRHIRTDTVPDSFAPVLRAGERATLATAGQMSAGAFTATGAGTATERLGAFALSVWGTFAATIRLECSFDGGTTWTPVYDNDGLSIDLTAPGTLRVTQTESGVLYRPFCSAFTSGAASWQIAG